MQIELTEHDVWTLRNVAQFAGIKEKTRPILGLVGIAEDGRAQATDRYSGALGHLDMTIPSGITWDATLVQKIDPKHGKVVFDDETGNLEQDRLNSPKACGIIPKVDIGEQPSLAPIWEVHYGTKPQSDGWDFDPSRLAVLAKVKHGDKRGKDEIRAALIVHGPTTLWQIFAEGSMGRSEILDVLIMPMYKR